MPISAEPWPEWGIAPGNLTPHGRKLMTLFGFYYRLYFAAARLLPSAGCEETGQLHVRADVDARNRETAQALVSGMMPGCKFDVEVHGEGEDPLFNPLSAGIGKPDRALAVSSISGRIGGDPDALLKAYQGAFDTLREVLWDCSPGTACPAETKPMKKSLLRQPPAIEPGKGDHPADLQGPLRLGSTLSEDLQLEYANGMEGKDLGWGRLDTARLLEVMPMLTWLARHPMSPGFRAPTCSATSSTRWTRRPKAARCRDHWANPATACLSSSDTTPTYPTSPACWEFPGFSTVFTKRYAPGGALVFELWQHGDHEMSVNTYYLAQSLEQMRKALPLTLDSPPLKSPVFVPGCSTADQKFSCPWKTFQDIVENAIDPSFVKP